MVWEGTVRLLPILLITLVGCGHRQLSDLPLQWRGVDTGPRPSPAVAASFAASPLLFRLVDHRPDLTAVGRYDDDGFIVRTSTNVGQYCTTQMGSMLANAGARLNDQQAAAVLEAELLEYNVVEGGAFSGYVRFRVVVRRGATDTGWAKVYIGKSKRWGKTHSPDNFNEALSNALADATAQLVHDQEFAAAIAPPPGA